MRPGLSEKQLLDLRLALLAVLSLALALAAPTPARGAAYLVLQVEDVPGEGFNDPSPFTPVGGNEAATLGEARLRALEFAAGLWADRLDSPVPIEIAVRFEPLGGTATSATLGLGGPVDVYRDFAGAPQPATWYPAALANRLAGTDLDQGTSPDVEVIFNLDVDGPQVLGSGRFYYGLDGHPPAGDASFVQVALHEIAHGLGFSSQLDLATGAKLLGYDDVYMSWVERLGAVPADLQSMSDAERLDALRSGSELRWVGPRLGEASAALAAGADGQGRVELHAPLQVTTSTLRHLATALAPDDLMEPFYADGAWDLTLARALLADLGWGGPPGCLQPGAAIPEEIPTVNASFEEPVLADGGFTASSPPGWTLSGSNRWIVNQTNAAFPGASAGDPGPNPLPDGVNAFASDNGVASQVVGAVLEAETLYRLTVGVGKAANRPFPGYLIELRAGGEVLASERARNPPPGEFVEATLYYWAEVEDAHLGEPLEIRLIGLGRQTSFDGVGLEAARR